MNLLNTWQFNVAVYLVLDEDMETCREVWIALGAVAPVPLRAKQAEDFLSGKKIEYSVLAEAGKLAAAQASPISDIRASAEYRKEVLEVLVRRALEQAYKSAAGKEVE